MADSTLKYVISLGGVVLGAYALYEFMKRQCATGGNLSETGVCSLFRTIGGDPVPAGVHPTAPAPAPAPPSAPPGGGAPSDPPPATGDALAAQRLRAAAGTNSLNFDQWGFYWNAATWHAGGALSSDEFGAMLAAGGGDRSKNITAEEWLGYLKATRAGGLAGVPLAAGGVSIPVWVIHRRGFS